MFVNCTAAVSTRFIDCALAAWHAIFVGISKQFLGLVCIQL